MIDKCVIILIKIRYNLINSYLINVIKGNKADKAKFLENFVSANC